MIGEEVDDRWLRFEGVHDDARMLLAFFGYDGGSQVGQHRRAMRTRPVAQEELEGRDVLAQQRTLGRGPALLVLEVDRRICVEQKTYDFNLTLVTGSSATCGSTDE